MDRLSAAIGLAAVLGAAPVQAAQQPIPPGTLAIEHVSVINVETGTRAADQTVVITGNTITEVGPAARVKPPAGARVVDGRGKFLVPGIWDMHVHALRLMRRALPLAVAIGITGIRDMGSTLEQVAEARTEVSKGTILAPRLFLSGWPLNGTPDRPGFPPGAMITTPEEGRQIVEKLAAAKVNQVKIRNEIARDTYLAIAAEAKRQGLPFDGHLPLDMNIDEASDAGQRVVEHMGGLRAVCAADPATLGRGQPGGPPNTQPIAMNQSKCEATIRHLVRNGTWLTPTVSGPGAGDRRTLAFDQAIIRMAVKGGLKLLAGNDWPGPGYSFGDYSGAGRTILDELVGLTEAGLTPAEVLRIATTNPVTLYNMKDQLGSVERGKLADLDLLDADPLADIGNIKSISAVVINGRLVDAAERKKVFDDEQAARKSGRPAK